MSARARSLLKLLSVAKNASCVPAISQSFGQAVLPALATSVGSSASFSSFRNLHFSSILQESSTPTAAKSTAPQSYEPSRKFRPLHDKEMWAEAWMYEDKFGTEDDPIIVPSTLPERIIGVTDPEDETLVVWGVLKAGDPPTQFIEGGEFFVLKEVPYIMKVGDVLETIEADVSKASLAK